MNSYKFTVVDFNPKKNIYEPTVVAENIKFESRKEANKSFKKSHPSVFSRQIELVEGKEPTREDN